MASLRKLKRRALRWQRYEHKVYGPQSMAFSPGAIRVLVAVHRQEFRRSIPYAVTETALSEQGLL